MAAAWLGLRRAVSPSRLRRLARITEPRRFVRAAIVPAGGPLALALALLPRARRAEAAIAVLACRALGAFDRRPADPAAARDRIAAAIGDLTGETDRPPAGAPRATRPEDPTEDRTRDPTDARTDAELDDLLAARLPALRAALDALPGDGARRCRDLIDRIGESLARARGDRRGHADRVRGEAVAYAARLAAPSLRPPVAACKAAGRALRLRRELDAAVTAHARDVVLDRALPALAFVPRLLRWLPAAAGPGTRAAITVALWTAFPLSPRELTVAMPWRLRHPLCAALAAAWSRRAFLGVADDLEAVLHGARGALFQRLDGPAITAVPPGVPADAVMPDAALSSLAMELVGAMPTPGRAITEPRGAAGPGARSG